MPIPWPTTTGQHKALSAEVPLQVGKYVENEHIIKLIDFTLLIIVILVSNICITVNHPLTSPISRSATLLPLTARIAILMDCCGSLLSRIRTCLTRPRERCCLSGGRIQGCLRRSRKISWMRYCFLWGCPRAVCGDRTQWVCLSFGCE